jgi:hypothetical protein
MGTTRRIVIVLLASTLATSTCATQSPHAAQPTAHAGKQDKTVAAIFASVLVPVAGAPIFGMSE